LVNLQCKILKVAEAEDVILVSLGWMKEDVDAEEVGIRSAFLP
jgi:hypothetical protein